MSDYRPTNFKLIPDVVKNLMIINGLLFLATYVAQGFGLDLVRILGLHYVGSEYFRPYQFATHIFMHGSFLHIFSNMFMLWMFGSRLEHYWGPKRFLFFYFFTGFGAALLHSVVTGIELNALENAVESYLAAPSVEAFQEFINTKAAGFYNNRINDFIMSWSSDPNNPSYAVRSIDYVEEVYSTKINIPTVGASGAVFGVLLAFGMLFPNSIIIIPILLFMPLKAKYLVIFYGLFELYAGFTSFSGGSNIAHFAHLGGMLFGFLLIKFWSRSRGNFY